MKLYEKVRVLDYILSLIFCLYSKCKQQQQNMTGGSNAYIVQLKPTLKEICFWYITVSSSSA